MMPNRIRLAAIVVPMMLLVACGTSKPSPTAGTQPPVTVVNAAYRSYFSIKELRADTDSVLLGRFGGKTSSQLDNGGNPADTRGTPVSFFQFEVSKVISGRELGSRIEVLALEGVSTERDVSLQPRSGEEVVIFARVLSATNAPGLKLAGPTVNAVGGNNGVFDVANGRAKARFNVVSADSSPTAPDLSKTPLLDLSLPELEVAANKPG
jgi:hypothetical protein